MNPEMLQNLLPCYVCGDLPPDVEGQVREAIEADPGLASQVDALALGREECRRALVAAEAALPALTAPRPPRRWHPLPWAAGVVAAVFFAAILSHLWAPDVSVGVAVERPQGLVTTSDPAALSAALQAQGAEPALAAVADLSAIGLRLVGGAVLDGDVLVVYDLDGVEVRCQLSRSPMITAAPTSRTTHAGVSVATGEAEGRAWAQWSMGDVVCLFTAPMSAPALLALVEARLDLG